MLALFAFLACGLIVAVAGGLFALTFRLAADRDVPAVRKLVSLVMSDRLAQDRLLRIMVVIVGEGPRANGIPEMYYPSEYLNRDPILRWITAIITDRDIPPAMADAIRAKNVNLIVV